MFGISGWELLVVAFVLFLAVGPAKLPGLAKQIGKGVKDLRKGLSEMKGQVGQDDEFVKAVREARESVREAKESIRTMFDMEDAEGESGGVADVTDQAETEVGNSDRVVARASAKLRGGGVAESSIDGPVLLGKRPPARAAGEAEIAAAEPPDGASPAADEPAKPGRRLVRPAKKRPE